MTIGNATGRTQMARRTQLRAPEDHRNHGQDVIESGNRMAHAAHKPNCSTGIKCEANVAHRITPNRIAIR